MTTEHKVKLKGVKFVNQKYFFIKVLYNSFVSFSFSYLKNFKYHSI